MSSDSSLISSVLGAQPASNSSQFTSSFSSSAGSSLGGIPVTVPFVSSSSVGTESAASSTFSPSVVDTIYKIVLSEFNQHADRMRQSLVARESLTEINSHYQNIHRITEIARSGGMTNLLNQFQEIVNSSNLTDLLRMRLNASSGSSTASSSSSVITPVAPQSVGSLSPGHSFGAGLTVTAPSNNSSSASSSASSINATNQVNLTRAEADQSFLDSFSFGEHHRGTYNFHFEANSVHENLGFHTNTEIPVSPSFGLPTDRTSEVSLPLAAPTQQAQVDLVPQSQTQVQAAPLPSAPASTPGSLTQTAQITPDNRGTRNLLDQLGNELFPDHPPATDQPSQMTNFSRRQIRQPRFSPLEIWKHQVLFQSIASLPDMQAAAAKAKSYPSSDSPFSPESPSSNSSNPSSVLSATASSFAQVTAPASSTTSAIAGSSLSSPTILSGNPFSGSSISSLPPSSTLAQPRVQSNAPSSRPADRKPVRVHPLNRFVGTQNLLEDPSQTAVMQTLSASTSQTSAPARDPNFTAEEISELRRCINSPLIYRNPIATPSSHSSAAPTTQRSSAPARMSDDSTSDTQSSQSFSGRSSLKRKRD